MVTRNMPESFDEGAGLRRFVKSYIANALWVAKREFPVQQWSYVVNNLSSGPQVGLDHAKYLGKEIMPVLFRGAAPYLVKTDSRKIIARYAHRLSLSKLDQEADILTFRVLNQRRPQLKARVKYLKGE